MTTNVNILSFLKKTDSFEARVDAVAANLGHIFDYEYKEYIHDVEDHCCFRSGSPDWADFFDSAIDHYYDELWRQIHDRIDDITQDLSKFIPTLVNKDEFTNDVEIWGSSDITIDDLREFFAVTDGKTLKDCLTNAINFLLGLYYSGTEELKGSCLDEWLEYSYGKEETWLKLAFLGEIYRYSYLVNVYKDCY